MGCRTGRARRAILAASCLLAFAMGGAPAESAPATVSIGTTGITAGIWPLMVGMKQGFFRAHGIDADLVAAENVPVNVQALIGGSVQFVSAGADSVVVPAMHGADLAVVAGIENLFVVRLVAGKGIHSLRDLQGKRLSVSRANGPDAAIFMDLLAGAGLEADPALFVTAGGSASRLAAVANGGAAATVLVPPEDLRALGMGLNDLGLNVGRTKPLQFNVLFLDRKWGKANEPVVIDTLRGLIDSLAWLNDAKNRDGAAEILAAYTKIDPETARKTYDVLVTQTRSFPQAGEINLEGFNNVVQVLAGFGVIEKPAPDASRFIDMSYAEKAGRR